MAKNQKEGATRVASSPKQEAVKAALAQIEKKYGQGAIMKMGDASRVDIARMPTGSISLDMAIGGGLPKGRIIEIYGPESSGKTTLTLHMISEAQKLGGQAAFIDAEHALDPEYARAIGVDIDNLLISQPDTGEQALEIVETLVRSNAVDIIVIDSVAALVPAAEIEGEMGDAQMGLQARLMSQALRKLAGIISKSNVTVVFLNQLRMKIGVMFGNPETTTGGNALKFYASVRMDIRKIANIEMGTGDDKEVIGSRVRVKIVKNKTAAPFRVAEFDIMYGSGISYEGDLLDLASKFDVVKKSGAFYTYKDLKLGQGRENAKMFLKGDSKTMNLIKEDLKKLKAAKAEMKSVPSPDESEDEG